MGEPLRCALVHDGVPIAASGLPAMAAALRDRGVEAGVWDRRAERNAGVAPPLADDLAGIDLLGLSIHWFYQLPRALALAREARALGFAGHVVAGGFTASLFADELLRRHLALDSVVRGDGELPLDSLCTELASGRPRLSRVPNLTWRDRGGAVRANPLRYVGDTAAIDRLDFARLDTIRRRELHLDASSWRSITDGSPALGPAVDRTLYLCGGRGCTVDCASCGGGRRAHRAHSGRAAMAWRSPARIADDIEAAAAVGCTSVHACFDPAPNGPHWHAVMDEVERRGVRTTMLFESFALPDARFLERFAAVFDGGVLILSPETADAEVRRRIRGFSYDNDTLERTLRRIGELGLRAQVFFGYPTPFEGVDGVHRTRRWARALAARHRDHADVLQLPYSTDPGSPLFRDPAALELRCELSTAADYERELGRVEPWLDNLLRHRPRGDDEATWRAATLGIELEQACGREAPGLLAAIEGRLGDAVDRYFLALARRLLRDEPPARLARDQLVGHVARAVGAARAEDRR